jgi:hypothetical protein
MAVLAAVVLVKLVALHHQVVKVMLAAQEVTPHQIMVVEAEAEHLP